MLAIAVLPMLLLGAGWREPEPVEIVYPVVQTIGAGEADACVSVPGIKAVEYDAPQAERLQVRRYPGANLDGLSANAAQIVMYLLDAGMEPEAICGVLANVERESGCDSAATNGIGAVGLCQWLGSRARNLYQREDWNTIPGQLAFLLDELATTESAVDLSGSAYDCGYRFARDYERTGIPGTYADRGRLAQEIYEEVFEP